MAWTDEARAAAAAARKAHGGKGTSKNVPIKVFIPGAGFSTAMRNAPTGRSLGPSSSVASRRKKLYGI